MPVFPAYAVAEQEALSFERSPPLAIQRRPASIHLSTRARGPEQGRIETMKRTAFITMCATTTIAGRRSRENAGGIGRLRDGTIISRFRPCVRYRR